MEFSRGTEFLRASSGVRGRTRVRVRVGVLEGTEFLRASFSSSYP